VSSIAQRSKQSRLPAAAGDRAWKDVLERHHALVRRELARHRGMEVDTAGDGFFAPFDGQDEFAHAARLPEKSLVSRGGRQKVKEFCAGKVADVRAAVLYEKPRSRVRCEYVWRRTDRWITFPWSADEPVGDLA